MGKRARRVMENPTKATSPLNVPNTKKIPGGGYANCFDLIVTHCTHVSRYHAVFHEYPQLIMSIKKL